MHWVRTGVIVVDYDADGCVCAEVHDIPFWVIGVGVVLLFGEEENGIVVVALEGIAVHIEELLPGGVDELVNCYVIAYAWFRESEGIVGDCFVERVLQLDQ